MITRVWHTSSGERSAKTISAHGGRGHINTHLKQRGRNMLLVADRCLSALLVLLTLATTAMLSTIASAQTSDPYLNRLLEKTCRVIEDTDRMIKEREQASRQQQASEQENISKLSCAQLDFMAKKYQSIGDSAYNLAMKGSTPAAMASQATATQAYYQSQRYMQEMARRCFR
jgi:hypothetical protein